MMELKKWLQSQGENKRAFYIFTILSLVLCFFLIVNACYVIYGTRYNEYKVTQNATIDLVKPDGTIQKNINPRFSYPGGSRIRIHVPVSLHSDKSSIPWPLPQPAYTTRYHGTARFFLTTMNLVYPETITSAPSSVWQNCLPAPMVPPLP